MSTSLSKAQTLGPTPVLLIDAGESGDLVQRQLLGAVRDLQLEVRQIADIEVALADLKLQVATDAAPPLIVLGPHLKNPVVTARQIHRISPLSYLVFMADGERTTELRQSISPLSMIGSDWSIAPLAGDDLARAVRTATQSVRQRQRLRATLGRINSQMMIAKPSTGADERQRYAASYRLLESILENASDAIVATDNSGIVTTWNRAAERLFGLPERDAVGQPIHAVAAGAWAERLPALIEQLGAGVQANGIHELQCRRLDGAVIETELAMTPVCDESGRTVGLSAIVRDVTERKQAAEALRESQQRLQSIIDNSTAVIYVKDIQGRYQLINRRFAELFHVAQEKFIGRTDYDLFSKEQADIFRANDQAALTAGKAVESEETAPLDDGLHTYISIKAPLRDEHGLPYATYGISTDITQRKRDEEALRQSEERIGLIVNSSLDAIVTIDAKGKITGWNPQAETVFGWRCAEVLGLTMEHTIVPLRFREAHRQGMLRFASTGEGPALNKRIELAALRKNGEEFPIELTISPLPLGDRYEFSAFVRDITERKRMEDALQNMNRQLELRVAERTAELARSNDALERSNVELQQFAYIASHDLQSPLRSISGFVQLLQKDYAERLDQQANQWIERVVESTKRMQALIRDLLVYSRNDSEARPFAPTDTREVFDHAIEALQSSIRSSGAEVTCGDLPTVSGDRSQFVQLLQNLIDNGIKYRSDEPPRIRVTAEAKSGEWLFSVRDNGIGIAPKHSEKIFGIFQRLHTQHAYPGTGIGLAICRRVVHRHHGRIWVESEVGKGSVFYFTISERQGD